MKKMVLIIEKNSPLGGNNHGKLLLNSQLKEPSLITMYSKIKKELNLMTGLTKFNPLISILLSDIKWVISPLIPKKLLLQLNSSTLSLKLVTHPF